MGEAISVHWQGTLEESHGGRIFLDVLNTMQALKVDGSGTYFFQPKAVEIATRSEREIQDYPTYLLIPGKFIVTRRDHNKRHQGAYHFKMWAFGRAESSEGDMIVAMRMAHDIGKALAVDLGRGTDAAGNRNAWDTELLGADPEPGRFGKVTFLEMRYRCPTVVEDGKF